MLAARSVRVLTAIAFCFALHAVSSAQQRSPKPAPKTNPLIGAWEASEEGFTVRLVFKSATVLEMEGEEFRYELTPTVVRVMDEEGQVDYPYTLSGDVLTLTLEEGEKLAFRRAGAATALSAPSPVSAERRAPEKGPDQNHLLVGKFMSYSSASSSTGSSSWTMYVTFDGKGNFEWSSESAHSARQYDQTGAQTGSGLAYGSDSGNRGTYRVVGDRIIATFNDGSQGEAVVKERFQDGSIGAFTFDGKTYAR